MLAPLRWLSLQPKGFFRRTRGRIYVAFGEHPAAGVCVCVCSLKLDSSGLVVKVFVGVCSFVSLFADSRLSLFPCLVGCFGVWSMCACVFFVICGTFSPFVTIFGDIFCVFLAVQRLWDSIVTLGAPLCHLWWMFLVLGGVLSPSLLIFDLRLGALGYHFDVFLRLWGRTLAPFSTFLEKVRKTYKKGENKGAEMDAFSMEFRVFPENAKMCFDCAGASGLMSRPLLF